MVIYTLTHDHRHGTSTYLFESNKEDLETDHYGGESGNEGLDTRTQYILGRLGIDYEPDSLGESIHINIQGRPETVIF